MTHDQSPGATRRPSDKLQAYVRWYDEALPRPFCERLIASFQQAEAMQVRRDHGWREGLEDSAWTELDLTPLADAGLKQFFHTQIDNYLQRYNRDLGLSIEVPATPLLAELRMKRYRPESGDGFQLHFDSINAVANRYLVFLWYLNDVAEGGETEFPDFDISIAPQAGRLLMFPPYWMFQHTGRSPRSGEKYILSTYLLFPDKR